MDNPYVGYCASKGYSFAECRTPSKQKRQYPLTIGWRTFHSEEEYQEALREFMSSR